MNAGTYPLAAAMINQLNRVDTISNNLANANTNGFKQEGLSEGSFNNYLQKAQAKGETPLKESEIFNTVPKIDAKYISSEQGAIVPTANEMDFALKHPDTFFMVQGKGGEVLYTRDGAFKSLDGQVVTGNGMAVLSADGEPLSTEDAFGPLVGVVKVDFTNLEKVGDNNYRLKNQNERELIEDNSEFVLQGAVEKSNVNSVTAMVALIDAHRRFEQAQKGVMTIDEINSKVIERIGSGK